MKKIDAFIKRVNRRKWFFIAFLIALPFIISVSAFIITVEETQKMGVELLGQARYDDRMFKSYTLLVSIWVMTSFMVFPFIYLAYRFFNDYVNIFKSLSESDTDKLLDLNDKVSFFNRFTPTYIIKNDSIIYFTVTKHVEIKFVDINYITISESDYREYKAVVEIQTKEKLHRLFLMRDPIIVTNLINEALAFNPQISISYQRKHSYHS